MSAIKYRAVATLKGQHKMSQVVSLDEEDRQVHFMLNGVNTNEGLIDYWNTLPPSRSTGWQWKYELLEAATV